MFPKDEEIRLTKKFFDENLIKELSAAQLTYFQIVTMNLPDFNNQITKLVVPQMEIDRRE